MLLWRFTFLTGLTRFLRNGGPDKICRSKCFSPVDDREMCLYSPDISTTLFPLLCLQQKGAFRLVGARYVTYWYWPRSLKLTLTQRGCVCVCVCMRVFSNGLGQTSYTSHIGADGRWLINLQYYFLPKLPRCVCHTKRGRIPSDDYNDTEQNGQWTWKDTRESGHSRCQIAVRHFDCSMSYITTATEQTETETNSKRQTTASLLRKFTLQLPVKYINVSL
jgi:hypothetical protein